MKPKPQPPIVQVSTAVGAWMPDRDPARIGIENFSVMQNVRYTEAHPIGVAGFRMIGLAGLLSIATEGGDPITTEGGDPIQIER